MCTHWLMTAFKHAEEKALNRAWILAGKSYPSLNPVYILFRNWHVFTMKARKKRKPALDDLRKLLVTYHGLQQMQRELNEQLALCEHQIAKHKFGSVSGKPRRRRGRSCGRPYVFPRVRSPLREVVRVEEDLPTFWGRVGEWLWRWWWRWGEIWKMDHLGDWWFSLARPPTVDEYTVSWRATHVGDD